MINYVTGYEYSGKNADILAQADVDEVVTFKQAAGLASKYGKSSKALKGLKKAATLIRYSKTEKVEDEKGKVSPKPIYFSVFSIEDVFGNLGIN